MFMNPKPADDVLINSAISGEGGNGTESCRSGIDPFIADIYIQQLIDYYGRTDGKLLAIQCGYSELFTTAQEKGFDVTCVKLSHHASDKAGDRIDSRSTVHSFFKTIDNQPGQFDVCVLVGAIERVREPLEFLDDVYRALKPDGVLFIITSALDSWPAKLLKNDWTDFSAKQLHYFDSQTMQNALNKIGFKKIALLPTYRYLSAEHIVTRCKQCKYSGILKLITLFLFILPRRLKEKHFKVATSGMSVLSRKERRNPRPTVSIIVPVYNEISTFPELISALQKKDIPGMDKEIIIVESNSTDGTREEAVKCSRSMGIKLVLEEKPQGKGHAVRAGLEQATGDFVMIQDGDLEYDLNDYDQLLEPLAKYQKAFVLGSRHSKGWKMRHFASQPFVALVMNLGQIFFTTLLNVFCQSHLKDPFTMYKVIRRDCLYGLTLKANRFDFDWELVIKLLRKGYQPLEIPVNYSSRSYKQGKKVTFIKDPILWIWALIRFRFGPLYQKTVKEHTLP